MSLVLTASQCLRYVYYHFKRRLDEVRRLDGEVFVYPQHRGVIYLMLNPRKIKVFYF